MIKRQKRKKNFTIIDNEVFNSGLKADAIGVLVTVLSLPDDWVIRKVWLREKLNIGRKPLDRIFKELIEIGYVKESATIIKKGGRFAGKDYTFYDVPQKRNRNRNGK